MTPRLTKTSRAMHCHEIQAMKSPRYLRQGRLASKPSPAERLRQRRKARAAVMRSLDRRDEVDLHIAYLMGKSACTRCDTPNDCHPDCPHMERH